MKVTKVSNLTGKEHTLELPVTEEQLREYYENKAHIQNVFPNLSREEREFIKTGITPEEWQEIFG